MPASVLPAEVTKIKVKRQNVEQPDDPEVEARMSQQTNTWWWAGPRPNACTSRSGLQCRCSRAVLPF
jgi:hypothetical protein